MGAAPDMQLPVLALARSTAGDALRVTDDQGPDTLLESPGDDGLGGFVVGLADPTAVVSFGASLAGPETAPPAAASLTPTGCLGAHVSGAGFGVGQMEPFLGADRPCRDQQPLIPRGNRIGVDDPQIDARDPARNVA